MKGTWIRQDLSRDEFVEDLDGVSWHEAPIPRWWHRCRPQTRGFMYGEAVERCACGALWSAGLWIERNSRRKVWH